MLKILIDRFPGGKTKVLTMSYDDGTETDRTLVKLLNKYGIRATFFLSSGSLDKRGYLSASEIKSLFAKHEVGVHTVNHLRLESLPTEFVTKEILDCRVFLENLMGYPIKGFAYPYGTFNEETLPMLPSLGIEYARTTKNHKNFTIPGDYFRWSPTCKDLDDLMMVGNKFLDYKREGTKSLLYVWGHSRDTAENKWEVLEDFCKLVGNNGSIWYATNGDFIRYMKALQSLSFSASGEIVHNPSAISVWISVDGTPVKVDSGKTLKL